MSGNAGKIVYGSGGAGQVTQSGGAGQVSQSGGASPTKPTTGPFAPLPGADIRKAAYDFIKTYGQGAWQNGQKPTVGSELGSVDITPRGPNGGWMPDFPQYGLDLRLLSNGQPAVFGIQSGGFVAPPFNQRDLPLNFVQDNKILAHHKTVPFMANGQIAKDRQGNSYYLTTDAATNSVMILRENRYGNATGCWEARKFNPLV